jgi:hypothetical protein
MMKRKEETTGLDHMTKKLLLFRKAIDITSTIKSDGAIWEHTMIGITGVISKTPSLLYLSI